MAERRLWLLLCWCCEHSASYCKSIMLWKCQLSEGRRQPCVSSIQQGAAKIKPANGFISLHQGLKENLLWLINSVKAWLIHPRVQRCFQIHAGHVLCCNINAPLGEEQQQHGCFQVDVWADPYRVGRVPGEQCFKGCSLDVKSQM